MPKASGGDRSSRGEERGEERGELTFGTTPLSCADMASLLRNWLGKKGNRKVRILHPLFFKLVCNFSTFANFVTRPFPFLNPPVFPLLCFQPVPIMLKIMVVKATKFGSKVKVHVRL